MAVHGQNRKTFVAAATKIKSENLYFKQISRHKFVKTRLFEDLSSVEARENDEKG